MASICRTMRRNIVRNVFPNKTIGNGIALQRKVNEQIEKRLLEINTARILAGKEGRIGRKDLRA